jgi:hypothetical protein
VTLGELRLAVADALDGLDPDWMVHPAPVDALTPPAFMLVWGDPTGIWLTPASFCSSYAQLEVVAVAARLEPDANYETLEAMVTLANGVLNRFAVAQTSAPGPFEIGQITYLAARILITQPVDIPGR